MKKLLSRCTSKYIGLLAQSFKWVIASVLSFVLVLGVTVACHEWSGISEEVSLLLAIAVATTVNFLVCRYVVFTSIEGPWIPQLVTFVSSVLSLRFFEYLAFLLFHTLMGMAYLPVLVSIQFAAFLLKFLVMRQIVFRKPIMQTSD